MPMFTDAHRGYAERLEMAAERARREGRLVRVSPAHAERIAELLAAVPLPAERCTCGEYSFAEAERHYWWCPVWRAWAMTQSVCQCGLGLERHTGYLPTHPDLSLVAEHLGLRCEGYVAAPGAHVAATSPWWVPVTSDEGRAILARRPETPPQRPAPPPK